MIKGIEKQVKDTGYSRKPHLTPIFVRDRNCEKCSKSSVCKYKNNVTEEIERITIELRKNDIPLLINFECKEFSCKPKFIMK